MMNLSTVKAAASVRRRPHALDLRETGVGAHGLAMRFAQDAQIYGDGDENGSFYKVVAGVVRTCKFRSGGRRQIDAFHLPGEFFGFDSGDRHNLSAEAVCDCAVVSYRWRAFETDGEIDERLAGQFFLHAMQNLRRAQDHALLLGHYSAAQKVAAFLIDLADRASYDQFIDLAMARHDIADYLGLTMETVSRTLSNLERAAVISRPTTRRIRITNEQALRRMSS